MGKIVNANKIAIWNNLDLFNKTQLPEDYENRSIIYHKSESMLEF